MIDKVTSSLQAALDPVGDGNSIMVAGFGDAGRPDYLIEKGLRPRRLKELTIISNNAGSGDYSLGGLIGDGSVSKIICSFPLGVGSDVFKEKFEAGLIEMELTPQGSLVERMRAAGVGVLGFYTRAPLGTEFMRGREPVDFDGVPGVLELPLRADVALLRGIRADRWGNVQCRLAARNFNPVMALAADYVVVQVDEIVELGDIPPEEVHIPGIAVDKVIRVIGEHNAVV